MLCEKCHKSKLEIKLPYLGTGLCSNCFCRLISKRVKKYVVSRDLITRDDTVVFFDHKSIYSKISKEMLGMLYCRKLIIHKPKKKEISAIASEIKNIKELSFPVKVVIPWCLDDEASYFLSSVFKSRGLCFIGNPEIGSGKRKIRVVKLLRPVLREECILFAKAKGIKVDKRNTAPYFNGIYEPDSAAMLDKIDKKHYETKFSLLKSIDELIEKTGIGK